MFFCIIADKTDEVSDLRLSRTWRADRTDTAKSQKRSKSEVVQDISSGNIDEFAQQLLEKNLKVFGDEERRITHRTRQTDINPS